MTRTWQGVAAAIAGLLFGVGLALSGMTRPSKVIGFLDVTGDWDPSLAGVMGGAIAVHAVVNLLLKRRAAPFAADRFALPTRRDIDSRLVAGAATFGIGWGLAGYCPGPGITSLVSGSAPAAVFVVAMLSAMWVTSKVERTAAVRARHTKVARS
jgi:uncharacterized membrane protein YedE/YeeE